MRRSPPGRSLRVLARCVLALVLLGASVEVALQVAARFAPDRAGAWRPGAAVRILCVGDSHTFGAGVPESRSYPAQLQALLDARAPGRYSVINLGVPGMTAGQVRERLPLQVARYTPDLVILWAGVNDTWARLDVLPRSAWVERLESLAMRSRLYRLVRVALHDLRLERADAPTLADGRHQAADVEECRGEDCELQAVWRLRHGGIVEVVENRAARPAPREDFESHVLVHYRAIERWLVDSGIPLILIRYPLDIVPRLEQANGALERVASERSVPLLDTRISAARVPLHEQEWVWAMHPGSNIYGEIARDLVPLVEGLEGR